MCERERETEAIKLINSFTDPSIKYQVSYDNSFMNQHYKFFDTFT